MTAANILFSNFAEAKLATPPSGTGGLTFSVAAGKGALFPAAANPNYFYGIFTNSGRSVFEVVKVITRSTDAMTIDPAGRALDGTTAQTWTANDTFYYGMTASMLSEFFGHVSQAAAAHAATAIANTPAGNIAATTVQAALNELDSEKVPATLTVTGTNGLSGGGALSGNQAISLDPTHGNDWTGQQSAHEFALTWASTIAPNMANGNNQGCTVTGNFLLDNPTNLVAGMSGRLRFKQDATGSRVISYGGKFKSQGGSSLPVLTTTANATDLLYYDVVDANTIYITSAKDVR